MQKVHQAAILEGSDDDILLLCFENERACCHRGLVAGWLLEPGGFMPLNREMILYRCCRSDMCRINTSTAGTLAG